MKKFIKISSTNCIINRSIKNDRGEPIPPCRAENPNVVKAYHQYKDKGLAILGVSLDGESINNALATAYSKRRFGMGIGIRSERV